MTPETGNHGRLAAVLKLVVLLPVYVGVLFAGTLVNELRRLVTWAARTAGDRLGHGKTAEPVTHEHRSR